MMHQILFELNIEELMPNFPIIDTHVHLWDPAHFHIPWLSSAERINTRFLAPEYAEHTRGVQIDACVYVEVDVAPHYALLEAQYINTLARTMSKIKGIVAAAPVEYGEQARAYYAALAAIGPRIKGVRRLFQGESDPNFAMRPEVITGVSLLAEYGLSFDLCIFHHQLPAVIELVKRAPKVQFILDHVAKPSIKTGELDPWRAHMRALAALPNVVCKISGMANEADMGAWRPADLQPYVAHVLEVFGEDRVMYGGDWPVSLLATSYIEWVQTLDELTAHLSERAKRKLWMENARRVYRLGV